jgi:hypothetical protein
MARRRHGRRFGIHAGQAVGKMIRRPANI